MPDNESDNQPITAELLTGIDLFYIGPGPEHTMFRVSRDAGESIAEAAAAVIDAPRSRRFTNLQIWTTDSTGRPSNVIAQIVLKQLGFAGTVLGPIGISMATDPSTGHTPAFSAAVAETLVELVDNAFGDLAAFREMPGMAPILDGVDAVITSTNRGTGPVSLDPEPVIDNDATDIDLDPGQAL